MGWWEEWVGMRRDGRLGVVGGRGGRVVLVAADPIWQVEDEQEVEVVDDAVVVEVGRAGELGAVAWPEVVDDVLDVEGIDDAVEVEVCEAWAEACVELVAPDSPVWISHDAISVEVFRAVFTISARSVGCVDEVLVYFIDDAVAVDVCAGREWWSWLSCAVVDVALIEVR